MIDKTFLSKVDGLESLGNMLKTGVHTPKGKGGALGGLGGA